MKLIAIIVSFHPEPAVLRRLVDQLLPQVDGLLVVDNGSNGIAWSCLQDISSKSIEYVDLGENRGVAAALNHGIGIAFQAGASHVILFDQDSLPEETLTGRLLAAQRQLEAAGSRVAAVGPQYVDPRSGYVAPFLATKGLRLRPVHPAEPLAPVAVDFLITSGCLISRESWFAIGPMEGPMFIDYVDIEWGLRARAKGFVSYGVEDARIGHTLGDRRMSFLGRSVPIHSPLRHYYQIRNPLWLYRQPWIPWNWTVVDGARLVMRFLFNALFVAPRMRNVAYMLRGFRDGLVGKLGRYGE